MEKQWNLPENLNNILQLPDFDPVVLQLLAQRGITTQPEIEDFFNSPDLLDPFLFQNMRSAVDLIIKHIKAGNRIAIVGDYDADGVTSSAVLVEIFSLLKAKMQVWIPSRLGEGYGLNKRIIDEIITQDHKLMITVDNGIKSKEEIAYAQAKGLETIVTDHHLGPEHNSDLPDCLIINSSLPAEPYPFKKLAGVGVAFKLACALVDASTLSERTKYKIKEKVVDLVAIGTIGDCVSVLGENRSLIKRGLAEINKRSRRGIVELLRVAMVKAPFTEWHVSWQIVPRLNVAGRLDHANSAYEILLAHNRHEAKALAIELNHKNIIRQNITREIVESCDQIVQNQLMSDKALILLSPDIKEQSAITWPEGVIGLVAGRIVEHYSKPSLVICKSHGKLKGSARSIPNFNIVDALAQLSDNLERFGGHQMAAGFTVKDDKLDNFIAQFKLLANQQLQDHDLIPQLKINAKLKLEQINEILVDQLNKLAPFGQDNPTPVFISQDLIINDLIALGADQKHLKIRLGNLWAIGFNLLPQWKNLKINDKIDIVYNLEYNEFNGKKSIQAKLIDLKLSN